MMTLYGVQLSASGDSHDFPICTFDNEEQAISLIKDKFPNIEIDRQENYITFSTDFQDYGFDSSFEHFFLVKTVPLIHNPPNLENVFCV